MFDRPTVIVLGAGASVDLGFPLGVKLRDTLIRGIDAEEKQRSEAQSIRPGPSGPPDIRAFQNDGFRALATYLSSPLAESCLPANATTHEMRKKLYEFKNDLESQTHDTVDKFIFDNPKHSFIGKILLAHQIMLAMYDREKSCLALGSFAKRTYGERRNWYQQLTNLIRDGAPDKQSLSNNKLCVVTFNYDKSLEQALVNCLGDTENHRGADYKEFLDILHVNGTPSSLQPNVTDVGKFILDCAQTFHLVDESVNPKVQEDRAKASTAVANAERIFVMGFDFAASNLSAIGLPNAPHKDKIFCLNFDGNVGLRQRMHNLGIPEYNIMSGSPNSPVHIDKALSDGFLEQ